MHATELHSDEHEHDIGPKSFKLQDVGEYLEEEDEEEVDIADLVVRDPSPPSPFWDIEDLFGRACSFLFEDGSIWWTYRGLPKPVYIVVDHCAEAGINLVVSDSVG